MNDIFLFWKNMTKLDLIQAQERFGELLALVGENGEQILIEKSGQAVAAIISYAELQRLQVIAEDARDSEIMRRAVEEHDGEFVTLEETIQGYNKLHGTDFTPESIINNWALRN